MKAIVSVIGHDKKGIIAKVSNCLYEMDINIEELKFLKMQNILKLQYLEKIILMT